MNNLKYILIFLFFSILFLWGNCQTVKQFNGLFNITSIKSLGTQYSIVGTFTDLNSDFNANNVLVGDQIVDIKGHAYKIVTISSIAGAQISTVCDNLNGAFPSGGQGIIFRPTINGFPLITNSTPNSVLNTVINTSTLSINSELPSIQVGNSLPISTYHQGDVVVLTGTPSSLYSLGSSGWAQVTATIPTSTSTSIGSVAIKPSGSYIYLVRQNKYYISDGTSWIELPQVTALPSTYKFGDLYYVTGENVLYMYVDDGAGNTKWMAISNSGISSGGTGDFPANPKPGNLYFNTDNNTLYLYDNTNTWVEVSTNGSTPADLSNPDPTLTTIKEGRLFYNSSEHQLYVFNGTAWIPVGNALTHTQIYVGNSSNIATPVPLSGDATITDAGVLTIADKAVTETKLDKANIPLSGFANPTANINMGDGTTNFRISNLLTPSAPQDAATKGYIDNLFSNPSTILSLAYNNLFVGNALNKAVATPKASIALSGFGVPTANISMGGKLITNLASPSNGTDAVNKDYVDTKQIYPIDISLYYNMLLQGNAQDHAAMVEKTDIPFSDFGAATKDVSFGGFKATNVADPAAAQDAATKNYVDTKVIDPANITLASGDLFVGNSSGRAAATVKSDIALSGFGAAKADVSMGTYKITNLAAPAGDADAANKKYIDDLFLTPANILALPAGNIFVGSALGKATPTLMSAVPVSGFGKAVANLYMGDNATKFTISYLADPLSAQDAATKNYVDTKTANPSSITLATDNILVGNASNQAEAVAKGSVPLSDFGVPTANLNLSNYKITNLADPSADADAVNKKYVTSQLSNASALPQGQFFVGDINNKAVATTKSTIPLSGFGAATADVALGGFKLTTVADPAADQDAATKKYVDTKAGTITTTQPTSPQPGATYYDTTTKTFYVYDGSKWVPVDNKLPKDELFVGDANGNAAPTLKTDIPLSGFGAATADVALGGFKLTTVADPAADQDAATKKYVDTKAGTITTTQPTSPQPGATYYDTTTKTFYVYDGSKWVPVDNKLPKDELFVGDANGNAAPTLKTDIPLSGFGAATADVALGGFKLTTVADPAADQDAATKKYVDTKAGTITTTQPTNPQPGATYYDTTTKTFYVYDGTNWVPVDNKLPKDELFVGDANGNAAPTLKTNIPLSGFGAATAAIDMGSNVINGVATPVLDTDAPNKKYVDDLVAGASSVLLLPKNNMLIGDDSGKAAAKPKSAISISGFGDAEANVSLGTGSNNYRIINLAAPTGDLDAANKKYVDDKAGTITTTQPTSPQPGATYYDTTTKTFYVYDGTKWVPVDNKLPQDELYVGDANGNAAPTKKVDIALSGFGAAKDTLNMGAFRLTTLADPVFKQDAATKKYVDDKAGTTTTVQPSNPQPGATYYDTTTKTFYVYDGTGWVPVDNKLPQDELYVGDANGNAAPTKKVDIALSGFGAAKDTLNMGAFRLTTLADPVFKQDAATKNYVDTKAGSSITITQPANPQPGATYYDTTTKTFYVFDGNGWVPVDNKLPKDELYVGDASGNAAPTLKTNIPLSGFGAAKDTLNMGTFRLTTLADPVFKQDAATKNYVDTKAGSSITITQPSNPQPGATYYDTTTKTFYVFDGNGWVPVDNKLPKDELYVGDASGNAAPTLKTNIPLSGFGAAKDTLNMGTFRLTTLADPVFKQDATTKKYVDDLVAGASSVLLLPKNNMLIGDDNGKAAAKPKSSISISGFGDAEANLSLGTGSNNYRIINLADPSGNQDAATKNYVDSKSGTTTKPTNPSTGATYYDLTDKTLYVFDGTGWVPAVLGDNLGNHTATKNLQMSTFAINNDGLDNKGLTFETSGNATFAQDVTVKGNFYTPSDQRLKTKIETLSKALQAIDELRGVRFEYKDQKKYAKGPKIGVIAQELQKVFPEMVTKGSDGYLKVDYTQLTGVLIQAIKEQQVQINELNNRLNKQQEQINSILLKLDKSR